MARSPSGRDRVRLAVEALESRTLLSITTNFPSDITAQLVQQGLGSFLAGTTYVQKNGVPNYNAVNNVPTNAAAANGAWPVPWTAAPNVTAGSTLPPDTNAWWSSFLMRDTNNPQAPNGWNPVGSNNTNTFAFADPLTFAVTQVPAKQPNYFWIGQTAGPPGLSPGSYNGLNSTGSDANWTKRNDLTVGVAQTFTTNPPANDTADVSNVRVASYSDWGFTAKWSDPKNAMTVTALEGSPYVYFQPTYTGTAGGVEVNVPVTNGSAFGGKGVSALDTDGNVVAPNSKVSNAHPEALVVGVPYDGGGGVTVTYAYYLLLGSSGSTWQIYANTAGFKAVLSSAQAVTYASVAALPQEVVDDLDTATGLVANKAEYQHVVSLFRTHGYAFPDIRLDTQPADGGPSTKTTPVYDPTTGLVTTTLSVTTRLMQAGAVNSTLFALFPHQWKDLGAAGAAALQPYTYNSPVGTMRLLMPAATATGSDAVTSFATVMTYDGVLSDLPMKLDPTADQAVIAKLAAELAQVAQQAVNGNYGLLDTNFPNGSTSDGTYKAAIRMGRLTNLIPVAGEVDAATQGTAAPTHLRDQLLYQLKRMLTGWLDATNAQFLYYNKTWDALFGYPEDFDMVGGFQDHHFMWGYFIKAAAMIATYDPAFIGDTGYGPVLDLMLRDVANWDRGDGSPQSKDPYPFAYEKFFDSYAGHPWTGNGVAGEGNNQEASGEAMNFSAAMILYGQALMAQGNALGRTIRDTGVYRFTTEEVTAGQYWLDVDGDNFTAKVANTLNNSVLSQAVSTSTTRLALADDPVNVRQVFPDPSKGAFEVLVGREIMLATAYNAATHTLTVVRGVENTQPAAHAAGALVALVTPSSRSTQTAPTGTLKSALTDSTSGGAATAQVSGAGFPAVPPPFLVKLDSTVQQVVGIDGTTSPPTWTFLLLYGTPVTHATGAALALIPGAIDQALTASAGDQTVVMNQGFNPTNAGFPNPAANPFLITVGGETMRVTAQGTTNGQISYTVTRGLFGTLAAHPKGEVVALLASPAPGQQVATQLVADGGTAIQVKAPLGFPGYNSYLVLVDGGTSRAEILRVTGGAGSANWQVARGLYGTSQITHAAGAAVSLLSTTPVAPPALVNTYNSSPLGAAISSSQTTLALGPQDNTNLSGGQGFPDPARQYYEIEVEGEVMLVTGLDRATNTLTVVRGVENSTPTAHAINLPVALLTPTTFNSRISTTLAQPITSAAAITLTVADGGTALGQKGFPAFGTFLIQIDAEILQVTQTAGGAQPTWTVTRGMFGTTAAAHADLASPVILLSPTNWTNAGRVAGSALHKNTFFGDDFLGRGINALYSQVFPSNGSAVYMGRYLNPDGSSYAARAWQSGQRDLAWTIDNQYFVGPADAGGFYPGTLLPYLALSNPQAALAAFNSAQLNNFSYNRYAGTGTQLFQDVGATDTTFLVEVSSAFPGTQDDTLQLDNEPHDDPGTSAQAQLTLFQVGGKADALTGQLGAVRGTIVLKGQGPGGSDLPVFNFASDAGGTLAFTPVVSAAVLQSLHLPALQDGSVTAAGLVTLTWASAPGHAYEAQVTYSYARSGGANAHFTANVGGETMTVVGVAGVSHPSGSFQGQGEVERWTVAARTNGSAHPFASKVVPAPLFQQFPVPNNGFDAAESPANAYHGIEALLRYGQVDGTVVARWPGAASNGPDSAAYAVFKNGANRTYIAYNYDPTKSISPQFVDRTTGAVVGRPSWSVPPRSYAIFSDATPDKPVIVALATSTISEDLNAGRPAAAQNQLFLRGSGTSLFLSPTAAAGGTVSSPDLVNLPVAPVQAMFDPPADALTFQISGYTGTNDGTVNGGQTTINLNAINDVFHVPAGGAIAAAQVSYLDSKGALLFHQTYSGGFADVKNYYNHYANSLEYYNDENFGRSPHGPGTAPAPAYVVTVDGQRSSPGNPPSLSNGKIQVKVWLQSADPKADPVSLRLNAADDQLLQSFIVLPYRAISIAKLGAPPPSRPRLSPVGPMTVDQGGLVRFTAQATDPGVPAGSLVFSLDHGAPAGAGIDAHTGAFTWVPAAPGVYTVTVRVTVTGQPAQTAAQVVAITVLPVIRAVSVGNLSVQPPSLTSISVVFGSPVTAADDAIELRRLDGAPVPVAVALDPSGTVAVLTFRGRRSSTAPLSPGWYVLTVHGGLIHDAASGLTLDGAGDGQAGSDRSVVFFSL